MAKNEELVETKSVVEKTANADIFIGIAGLTAAEDLRRDAELALSGLRAHGVAGRVIIAYPGAEAGNADRASAVVPAAGASAASSTTGAISEDLPASGLSAGTFQASAPQTVVVPVSTAQATLSFVTYSLPETEGPPSPWAFTAACCRSLLALAIESQAQVAVLLHPDLSGLQAATLERLTLPVLEKKAELVMPVYPQQRFDNLLNNSILAPLSRALYGKRAQFPLAADFSVSPRIAARLLYAPQGSGGQSGASFLLWPATVAANVDAPIAEFSADFHHAAQTDGLELSAVLAQLVGSLFTEMETNAPLWQRVRGSQPMSLAGSPVYAAPAVTNDVQVVDPSPMVDSFILGSRSLVELWGLVLPPVTLLELKRLSLMPRDKFRMPDELWVRILYDFALAFRLRTISRNHLLGALTPLYLGWVASYVGEVSAISPSAIEHRREQLAKAYEDGKPYLVRRWRWPDRFNP